MEANQNDLSYPSIKSFKRNQQPLLPVNSMAVMGMLKHKSTLLSAEKLNPKLAGSRKYSHPSKPHKSESQNAYASQFIKQKEAQIIATYSSKPAKHSRDETQRSVSKQLPNTDHLWLEKVLLPETQAYSIKRTLPVDIFGDF